MAHSPFPTLTVQFPSGDQQDYPFYTTFSEIIQDRFEGSDNRAVMGVLSNNELRGLAEKANYSCSVDPVHLSDPDGIRVYRRSLSLLLVIAVRRLFPDRPMVICHSLGYSYFYRMDITAEEVERVKTLMHDLVKQAVPFETRHISWSDAVQTFASRGLIQARLLVEQQNQPQVNVVVFRSEVVGLHHGPVAAHTGMLRYFEVHPYQQEGVRGLVLCYPTSSAPTVVPDFDPRVGRVLMPVFREGKAWGNVLGVACVGQLNDLARSERLEGFIQVAETRHDTHIAQIADEIVSEPQRRVILIAGPSSSGKTTFCRRLALHLRVLGKKTHCLGLDDYYLSRALMPRTPSGGIDFEDIECLDLAAINDHLQRLLTGELVELPHYNFQTGESERGEKLSISSEHYLLIEGIHALNPRLTAAIDPKRKFRVFISALTQLSLDDHTRISTADNRLLRRMVRDYRTRGYSPVETIERWQLVRQGEEKWIFPYQSGAERVFNSALDYELSVLKLLAEPLLRTVKPSHSVYSEARRLLRFLSHFVVTPHKHVPEHSLLREFIGGSVFYRTET